MKKSKQRIEDEKVERDVRIFVVVLTLIWILMGLVVAKNCSAEVIEITGNTNPEAVELSRAKHMLRLNLIAMQNDEEVDRQHELDIEVAKHKVAMDLESASAPKINVSSSAFNSNSNRNKFSNDNAITGTVSGTNSNTSTSGK